MSWKKIVVLFLSSVKIKLQLKLNLIFMQNYQEHAVPPSEKVELLSEFVESTSALQSSQYFSLEDLLSSQTNLYSFMQVFHKLS